MKSTLTEKIKKQPRPLLIPNKDHETKLLSVQSEMDVSNFILQIPQNGQESNYVKMVP